MGAADDGPGWDTAGPAAATRALVTTFHTAFAARDGDAMAACYAPDVVFSDPVFGELRGAAAGDMWRMLTARGEDLEVSHVVDDATATDARVRWTARYTFGATGRHVTNEVGSALRVRDGLVVEHRDTFDLWLWSRQALGPLGAALGWTPLVRRRVRTQARQELARFRERS